MTTSVTLLLVIRIRFRLIIHCGMVLAVALSVPAASSTTHHGSARCYHNPQLTILKSGSVVIITPILVEAPQLSFLSFMSTRQTLKQFYLTSFFLTLMLIWIEHWVMKATKYYPLLILFCHKFGFTCHCCSLGCVIITACTVKKILSWWLTVYFGFRWVNKNHYYVEDNYMSIFSSFSVNFPPQVRLEAS